MKDKKSKYNDEPVVACSGCKSLYVKDDGDGNTICMRCGSINNTTEFSHIEAYKRKVKLIWELI